MLAITRFLLTADKPGAIREKRGNCCWSWGRKTSRACGSGRAWFSPSTPSAAGPTRTSLCTGLWVLVLCRSGPQSVIIFYCSIYQRGDCIKISFLLTACSRNQQKGHNPEESWVMMLLSLRVFMLEEEGSVSPAAFLRLGLEILGVLQNVLSWKRPIRMIESNSLWVLCYGWVGSATVSAAVVEQQAEKGPGCAESCSLAHRGIAELYSWSQQWSVSYDPTPRRAEPSPAMLLPRVPLGAGRGADPQALPLPGLRLFDRSRTAPLSGMKVVFVSRDVGPGAEEALPWLAALPPSKREVEQCQSCAGTGSVISLLSAHQVQPRMKSLFLLCFS